MKFKIEKDTYGWDTAISCNGKWVLHLHAGTVINGTYLQWIISLLNGKPIKKPKHPFVRCKCGAVYQREKKCHECGKVEIKEVVK